MEITHVNTRQTALILVAMGAFLIPFMGSSLSIALPLIGKDFTGNVILLGWLPTVFTLANAAFLLPMGKLADIYGRKKVFAYGVIIYTVASLLSSLSPSVTFLIFSSFLQGLGCSLIFATGVALLSSVYPAGHRGEALGFFVTSVYIGLFLGPLLGGFLAQNLGWRSIFFFNVPLGLFLLILIFLKLKGEWFGDQDAKFDYWSSVVYIPSLIALFYGFTTLGNMTGEILFVLGLMGFFLFMFMDTKSAYPLLNFNLLRRKVTAFPAATLLIINISTTAMWTLLSLYLQDLLQLGPQITALILAVQPLMVAVLSPLMGNLSDRMDVRIFMVSGMAATTGGLLFLSTLTLNSELWIVVTGMVLVGVGIALFSPPATNVFLDSMPRESYGMASATQSTMVYAGQTLSLGILLLIFAGLLGNVQLSTSNFVGFLTSLKTAFIIFAVFSGLGVVLSLFVNNPDGEP